MTDNDRRRLSIPLNIIKGSVNTSKHVTNQRYITDFRRVSEDVNIPHHVNNKIPDSVSEIEMDFGNNYLFTPNNVPLDNRVIKFGYASLLENVNCESIFEESEQVSNNNFEGSINYSVSFGRGHNMIDTSNSSINNNHLFLLRKDNFKLFQLHSKCLTLKETMNLWYMLPNEIQENIIVMIEKLDALSNNNYDYFWIEDCYANMIKIVSVSNLMEICTNKKKSVRWKNLSNGNIIVHRYSIPYISPKYNLIFSNTIKNNRKCCLLSIWLFMIFVISLAIILTIILDSKESISFSKRNHTNFMVQG
uniref:Sortilin_C domain-containing protein n=1 Tax=Strongyloides papillosus TaxID=174720 RepID=A0A0N5CDP3_STREA